MYIGIFLVHCSIDTVVGGGGGIHFNTLSSVTWTEPLCAYIIITSACTILSYSPSDYIYIIIIL